jgi:hypothetical protein
MEAICRGVSTSLIGMPSDLGILLNFMTSDNVSGRVLVAISIFSGRNGKQPVTIHQ